MNKKVAIIIPNWNGEDFLKRCIDSLLGQTGVNATIIVVDNGSVDKSLDILESYGKKITTLKQSKNLGFAGGVNAGIRFAIDNNHDYIALLNNDAVAKNSWLENLKHILDTDNSTGIVTSKILVGNTGKIDSTGDWYTTSGLPFPRGRGEVDRGQYDKLRSVFGASGGASMYRATLFKDIGLFDEDFFAYYEDVDLSFRAQLRGWKIKYEPTAIVYHELSGTSSKLGNFTITQSAKNFWLLYVKNVPGILFFKYLPSALYRYVRMYAARLIKGGFWAYTKGLVQAMLLIPKKFIARHSIQSSRIATTDYIVSIIHKGKPPVVGVNDENAV
jgi:GT2 family glycosyltransferase